MKEKELTSELKGRIKNLNERLKAITWVGPIKKIDMKEEKTIEIPIKYDGQNGTLVQKFIDKGSTDDYVEYYKYFITIKCNDSELIDMLGDRKNMSYLDVNFNFENGLILVERYTICNNQNGSETTTYKLEAKTKNPLFFNMVMTSF